MAPASRFSRLVHPSSARSALGKAALLLWIGGVLIAAVSRAASAPAPRKGFASVSEEVRRGLFAEVVAAEPALRQASRKSFPGDRWSADDDFHSHELDLVRRIAADRRLPEATVWDALDEGFHAGWPRPEPPDVLATVPPCHPRPVD